MRKINGKILNELWNVEAKHALYREDGMWYHHLKRFPGALFDKNGYVLFDTELEYVASKYLQHGKSLHVQKGISEIPSYVQVINQEEDVQVTVDVNNEVIRKKREISVRLRNKKLVAKVKSLYQNTCQICRGQLKVTEKRYYSEVHHIVPLGNPHYGPDIITNMICVCPNHHILLDLGAIKLDKSKLLLHPQHAILEDIIAYHNQKIYGTM